MHNDRNSEVWADSEVKVASEIAGRQLRLTASGRRTTELKSGPGRRYV